MPSSNSSRSRTRPVAVFWPGDARAKPNELALPSVRGGHRSARARPTEAWARPLPRARLPFEAARGDREARPHRRSDGRRLRPLALRPAHDRRRRGQGQPAAAGEQLLRAVARPGGPAQHRRVPRDPRARASRARGPTRPTGPRTRRSWTGSTSGATTGRVAYPEDEIALSAAVSAAAVATAARGRRARSAPAACSSSCSATRRWA